MSSSRTSRSARWRSLASATTSSRPQTRRIIYATIKGFGTTGPYKDFKCFDWVAQAAGGAFSVTGEPMARPCGRARRSADTGSGMHAAMGILAAYIQRLQTGKGQVVEIAMQETVANFMRMPMSRRERNPGVAVPRTGNRMVVPTDRLPLLAAAARTTTSSSWSLPAGCGTALLASLDMHELLDDPRFDTHADRLDTGTSSGRASRSGRARRRSSKSWRSLGAAGVPCSAVYDTDDLFAIGTSTRAT